MSIQIMTTPGNPEVLSPDRTVFHPLDALEQSLIHRCTTPVAVPYNDRETVRIPYVSDYSPAGFVAEGAEIPEGDFEIDEVTVKTRKIAQVRALSNELANTPANGIENILGTTMVNALVAAADVAFLTNDDAGGPAGLNTLPGRTISGVLNSNLDPFTDAFAVIESEGGKVDDAWIICHPLDWSILAKLKAAEGSNQTLIAANPAEPGTRNIHGVPVYTSRFAERATITIGDRSNIPAAYSQVMLETDGSALFAQDSMMFRSKFRTGWNVMNPARIVTLSVTTPAPTP